MKYLGALFYLTAALCFGMIADQPVAAATTSITTTCKFVLGDNDTRNEAREVSFLQCKRKVLEKAGSYVQSQVHISDGKLTKEQVSIYTAAVLSVEVISENFYFEGNNMVLEQTVRADVDLDDVKKRLEAIVGDRSVAKKVESQHKRIKELEESVNELRRDLGTAKTAQAKAIRKEQAVTLEKIDEVSRLKIIIMQVINSLGNAALEYVEPGMNKQEVISLAGEPRSKTASDCYSCRSAWNYGKIFIHFSKSELVKCISKSEGIRGCRDGVIKK